MTNKLEIYQTRNEGIKQEILHIKNILHNNNSFPIKLINKFLDKHNNSINTTDDNKDIQSTEKYSLFGKETHYITKIFKGSILEVIIKLNVLFLNY